ncbi:MAG TPA: glycyl-radical enzyme activating protein [Dehalococcoidales bacterium]|nr:glycyl-radical enzyme activating protein [Dehalococcoidales bacterium]
MFLDSPVTVLDIQRMSTEDGPGLRTTLFLKGCNLRCDWCHNPESIDPRPALQWYSDQCIGCDSCRGACSSGALVHEQDRIRVDREKCSLCYSCAGICPSGALRARGKLYAREKLLPELLKDRAYFGQEGGITLSGGEPLLQAATLWLLKELKWEGLQTALDTAGLVPLKTLLAALDYTDLLLYDLKLIDSGRHRQYTGSGNERILSNLVEAGRVVAQKKSRLWIRTPLIPGVTANSENIAGLARFIKANLAGLVERWELCAFNNLCENKYRMLDIEWPYRKTALMAKADLENLVQIAAGLVDDGKIKVLWTGSAALVAGAESGDLR